MSSTATLEPLSAAELRELRARLAVPAPDLEDAERVDRLQALTEIISSASAARIDTAASFVASQRHANVAAGVPRERADRGVAAQVGLAMRVSPWQARRFVGNATILTTELPATMTQLRAGRITEWRAMIVARETAWLSREHRAAVDADLGPHLEGWGDRRVAAETAKAAYRLDPVGAVAKAATAANERRVGFRPCPDMMVRMIALLPVAHGVAVQVALTREADRLTAAGDGRSRGQIMADTAFELLTGLRSADALPVEIELIMTDHGLFGSGAGAHEPGHLVGYGPVPADWARQLALSSTGPRWLRRLFTDPDTGQLAAMDSRRRYFPKRHRRFVRLRDQHCRTPYCDAPIRHTDHVQAWEHGGPTSVTNAQGDCECCNYDKEAPGWSARPKPDGSVEITTPTGHHYRSRAPDPPGSTTANTSRVIVRHDPRVIHVTWFGHAA